MPTGKSRWILVFLGLFLMLCLGTVYSASLFPKPFKRNGNMMTATYQIRDL
ncbi:MULTISPECIES: hypothetical protein [unclassified Microcoleus]|uniref:hypothetical protein n=1 Tax=unclassified Microcoleus TaxID=2642155 RepID=UPI002FCFAF67